MGFFSSLFGGDSGKATQKAAKQNTNLIKDFNNQGQNFINQGAQQSQGFLSQVGGLFDGYDKFANQGNNAGAMYENGLGLNGGGGNAAATSAFQTSPGYEFQLDQGLQAAERAASAGGMLSSGNTLTALQGYGQGLANQEYGSWMDRLAGLQTQGLQTQLTAMGAQTAGRANALTNQANLAQGVTDQRLGLGSTTTAGLLGANNMYASGKEKQASDGGILGNALGGFIGNLGSKFKGF